jgi:hypothetical protein
LETCRVKYQNCRWQESGYEKDDFNEIRGGKVMKRTCLQKNTTCPDLAGIKDQRKLNTDEQNTSEFHPDDISFNERSFDPKDIQHIKSFVQMKKIILIPLFVLCIVQVFAQNNWPPIGAKWHFSYVPCNIWGGCSAKEYIYFEAVKDTLVNDTLCTKIIVEHHNGKKEVKYLGDEFFYSTENQVYSYHHGHFNLLYDFSVQVGDTVELFVDSNSKLFQKLENSDHRDFDSKPIKYSITKKDSVNIGGINTISIELKFLDEFICMPCLSVESQQIVKNIGSLDFLFGNFFTGIESGFYGPLRCYSDSTVNYTTDIPCDYLTSTERITDNTNVYVYPNPVSNQSVICFPNPEKATISISISDMKGKIVWSTETCNDYSTIESENLSKGVYMYRVITMTHGLVRESL